MAEGRKEYSSRRKKAKALDDSAWDTGSSNEIKKKLNTINGNKEICLNCNNLYKNKNTLASHQKKCMVQKSNKESFLKHHQSRKSYDKMGKVEPASQPLNRTTDVFEYNTSNSYAQVAASPAASPTGQRQQQKQQAQRKCREDQLAGTSPLSGGSNTRVSMNNALLAPQLSSPSLSMRKITTLATEEEATECSSSHNYVEITSSDTQNHFSPDVNLNEQHPPVTFSDQSIIDILNETFEPNTFLDNSESTCKIELPAFPKDERVLSKPYNNVDGPTFVNTIETFYNRTVHWRKNLFLLPSGQAGKSFIKLCTEWLNVYNNNSLYQRIAMKVVMVLPALMLQKPSRKSKTKDHVKVLEERLKLWNEGNLNDLYRHSYTIQKKLQQSKKQRSNEDISRIFSKLMFEGKVKAAMKFLEENAQNCVLQPNNDVIEKLKQLHPAPAADPKVKLLIKGPLRKVDPAQYCDIDEQSILKAANVTKGSGGPSQMDANQWRRMLCSNNFKNEAKDLRESLANFAKKIASETVDPKTLEAYVACRLIPLQKNPGEEEIQIRPIGIGEILRRIVGKTLSWSLGENIQKAAGPLQVSAGLKGGSEAAIHAMKMVFDMEGTDGVILVDAENAFNKLNRMVALHNIQYLCPALATVLINTYRIPVRLFIQGGGEIASMEGTTQGDNLAMAFYGISTKPILTQLRSEVPEIYQVWLADDASGGGGLASLLKWWVRIIELGKDYGYYVKPSKSWLIIKDPGKETEARALFEDTPIQITTDGKRHLGAAIGTNDFKEEYVSNMVTEWVRQIRTLTAIAKSQPHAAYSAYIHGEQHKFTYFLRTIENIGEILKPLDDVIENEFIPTLFGTTITEQDRELFALPIKDGGLGLRAITPNSKLAHDTSMTLTKPLIDSILHQSTSLPEPEEVKKAKSKADAITTTAATTTKGTVMNTLSAERKRNVEQTARPGASSWLGALPLESRGLNLNKGEFQDALCLRYDKPLKNLPSICPCTKAFNVTHAMNCHKGGFINSRHDNIKNFAAKLLEGLCKDVEVEPHLQPCNGVRFKPSVNTSNEARLDVRARGFWRNGQNAFFDVCITNAEADSQVDRSVDAILRTHETKKKTAYNTRIIEIEHGTLTPIIFTTKGAMGNECEKFFKALAQKLSKKKGEQYADIIRYIRIKLSFLVLKASLLCLRGTRVKVAEVSAENEDFNYVLNELSGR